MRESVYHKKIARQCEWLLYSLVLSLVFEGILRKLLSVIGTPMFFLKDVLCLALIFKIASVTFSGIVGRLRYLWFILFILFLPLLLLTSFKDPLLAFFGCKQYLLYIVTGITVTVAFPLDKEERFRRFIFFVSLMIIPTTLVAVLQNSLPASHWLNLSVGGASLEAFSAGGYLRVASTFSFTAQYSWFLVAESFFLATSFFMPPNKFFGFRLHFKQSMYLVLAIMLVIGAFITGGRTAVLGFSFTFLLGFLLISPKWPEWIIKGAFAIALAVITLSALRSVKPEFFMAYDERSSGNENSTHEAEMVNRILGGFTDWMYWFEQQDESAVWLGNGLGIMSNGSGTISSYALQIRNSGFWTEGDMATTFWEGGIYLAIIWYGFRIWIIFFCFRMWWRLQTKTFSSAASVPLAYIVMQGLIAQLGIQPPLSIWWWFAIGIVIFLHRVENATLTAKKTNIFPEGEQIFYQTPLIGLRTL